MDDRLKLAERLSRIETRQEQTDKELLRNGQSAATGIQAISDKLDSLDAKWDARFTALQAENLANLKEVKENQAADAKEFQAFKNKGAGGLAALGVVFTITATVFSDFFSHVKEVVFG